MSRFLELHAATLLHSPDGAGKGKGKAVLELGAGGGLPGLVAALEGAGKVRCRAASRPSVDRRGLVDDGAADGWRCWWASLFRRW